MRVYNTYVCVFEAKRVLNVATATITNVVVLQTKQDTKTLNNTTNLKQNYGPKNIVVQQLHYLAMCL